LQYPLYAPPEWFYGPFTFFVSSLGHNLMHACTRESHVWATDVACMRKEVMYGLQLYQTLIIIYGYGIHAVFTAMTYMQLARVTLDIFANRIQKKMGNFFKTIWLDIVLSHSPMTSHSWLAVGALLVNGCMMPWYLDTLRTINSGRRSPAR
jgi:hypothetical protein